MHIEPHALEGLIKIFRHCQPLHASSTGALKFACHEKGSACHQTLCSCPYASAAKISRARCVPTAKRLHFAGQILLRPRISRISSLTALQSTSGRLSVAQWIQTPKISFGTSRAFPLPVAPNLRCFDMKWSEFESVRSRSLSVACFLIDAVFHTRCAC